MEKPGAMRSWAAETRSRVPDRQSAALVLGVAVGSIATVAVAVNEVLDRAVLDRAISALAEEPARVAAVLAAFGLAFVARAVAWTRVVPALSFAQALAGLHLALGANHVLPLRLGEPFRVLSVVRRTAVPLEVATASTVALRSIDALAVVAIGVLVSPGAVVSLLGGWGWAVIAIVVAVGAAAVAWLARIGRLDGPRTASVPGASVWLLTGVSWAFESLVVLQSAEWSGADIGFSGALLVTAVAVSAQIVAIAPSGVGTYEAASVAAYGLLGVGAPEALVAALTAHALTTGYSLLVGAIAVFAPGPSLVGRFRLAPSPGRCRPSSGAGDQAGGPGPPGRERGPDGEVRVGCERVGSAGPARAIGPWPTRPSGDGSRRPESRAVGNPAGGGPLVDRLNRAPVVLFMPAFDEEESVGECIARCPVSVCGHPVRVVVVDDGSSDRTAGVARDAGARVVSLGENRGLGYAVRVGLADAVEVGAAAVAFCDADGEYPPEELDALVGPILDGRADYVCGSRFAGHIQHMRPHRRLGNLTLTAMLRWIAREEITDGQTGYRAFSPEAAADAEVIHDFNYAQVLTLDLLAKGYRYLEVPISYRFRTTGESFVRLAPYLRRVVPAVYRELNAPIPAEHVVPAAAGAEA